ncbi:MAG: cytochrome c [Terracidiphilus sp.]|nr:cytochrome c [Terracidiphilus sp.]
MGRVLLGVLLALAIAPICVLGWLRFGHPPVAVGDAPLPSEDKLTGMALSARIAAEQPKTASPAADEANLVAGAEIYRDRCAACHGYSNKLVPFAAKMSPAAPQLWQARKGGGVGVSGEPAAEIYWKIANGIRWTGMPAHKDMLSSQEIWQVSLLVAGADKPLPPAALKILRPQPGGIEGLNSQLPDPLAGQADRAGNGQ